MAAPKRQCATCRWFKDSGIAASGNCTHPLRLGAATNLILVRANSLECRDSWGSDYWQAKDDTTDPLASPRAARQPSLPSPAPSTPMYDDEVTSVSIAANRAEEDDVVESRIVAEQPDDDWQDNVQDERRERMRRGAGSAIEAARERYRSRQLPTRQKLIPFAEEAEVETADPIVAEEDRADSVEDATFPPDDFVEEDQTPGVAATPADDDEVVSDGVTRQSPRLRRLRREVEAPPRPKGRTAGMNSTMNDMPVMPDGPDEQDTWGSVPRIREDFRLPFRSQAQAPTSRRSPIANRERTVEHRRPNEQRPAQEDYTFRARVADMPSPAEEKLQDTAVGAAQPESDVRAQSFTPASPVRNGSTQFSTRSFAEPQSDVVESDAPSPPRSRRPLEGFAAQRSRQHATPPPREINVQTDGPSLPLHTLTRRSRAGKSEEVRTSLWRGSHEPEVFDDFDDRADDAETTTFRLTEGPTQEQARPKIDAYPEAATLGTSDYLDADDLLPSPAERGMPSRPEERFDIREAWNQDDDLGQIDMAYVIAPGLDQKCATCRDFHASEQPGRGWCTNAWAFTHRQMVNANELPCHSSIGCWWLPADDLVWIEEYEEMTGSTERVDRMLARLAQWDERMAR